MSGVYRWYALALLFLVSVVNYMDRFVFAVILEQVKREFGASDFALGLLSGAAFALFYAILGIPIARWADGGDRRKIIAGALAIWSAMTALCGFATSLPLLALARVGVGIGEAGGTPPSHSLVSDLFLPGERARALGILAFGGTVGSLLAFIVGAQLTAIYGWRVTLVAMAVPGLLLAALLAVTLREPRTATVGPVVGMRGIGSAINRLAHNDAFRWLCGAFALWGFVTYGLAQWFVSYLLRVRGLDLVQASSHAGMISAIAPAVGTLVGGWVADRLSRISVSWLGALPALCCLVAAPLYVAAGFVGSVKTMILLVGLAGFLMGMLVPAGYAALHAVTRPADRALGVAVAFFLLNLIGYGAGPAAIGLISDATSARFGPASIAVALGLSLLLLVPRRTGFRDRSKTHAYRVKSAAVIRSTQPSIVADYVIVGAGSAGCVLANRLSEDPAIQVVLLEAGGHDRPRHRLGELSSVLSLHVPAGFAQAMLDPEVTWPYLTEPDQHTQGRQHFWPRGRVLGGSSSINGLLYVRGQREDYDGWRQLGCDGWGWDDVEPFFKRIERRSSDVSSSGAVHVSEARSHHPVSVALIAACGHAGIPFTEDYNGPEQEGAGWFQTTQRSGRRHSAASAYLHPVTGRSNLRVITGGLAQRIVLDGRRADGVEISRDGSVELVRARREVVVSAGAVNSPQLLLLSGIGPAEYLREFGLTVVQDAPEVGLNLQDHYTLYNEFRLRRGVPSINTAAKHPLRETLRYAFGRSGLFASAAAEVAVFLRSNSALDLPDIQFHGLPGCLAREADGSPAGLKLDDDPGLTLTGCQMRPESRGDVSLRSSTPSDAPRIRPNYLSAERDQAMAVTICHWARRIAAQSPLAELIEAESFPGQIIRSDDEILNWARRSGGSVYHPVGTCRMGADARSVVDARLRVRGVDGLRVVDASIMPRIVSGNTHAAAMMIGERASEMIRRNAA